MGVVHFDTARSYQSGNNERMVGAALKGKRQQVVLSSKTEGADKAEALAELDTSLRELGTDHLDIWYLHQKNDPAEVTDDLLEAQRMAKQAGKIRFAGVSTHFNMDQHAALPGQAGADRCHPDHLQLRHAVGGPGCRQQTRRRRSRT